MPYENGWAVRLAIVCLEVKTWGACLGIDFGEETDENQRRAKTEVRARATLSSLSSLARSDQFHCSTARLRDAHEHHAKVVKNFRGWMGRVAGVLCSLEKSVHQLEDHNARGWTECSISFSVTMGWMESVLRSEQGALHMPVPRPSPRLPIKGT
jgi:hypothetical protein